MAELAKWGNFYVIVGPSAGALIGVQFVVVTLLANMRVRPTAESVHAFETPTVVYFGGALLVSALMSVPWPSFFPTSVALAVCGLGGLGYVAVVVRRIRRQTLHSGVGRLALVRDIAVCPLRRIRSDRIVPQLHDPTRPFRHRGCIPRPATRRDPQRLGYSDSHRCQLQRRWSLDRQDEHNGPLSDGRSFAAGLSVVFCPFATGRTNRET